MIKYFITSFTEYIKITQYQIKRIKLKYIEIKNMTYFLIKQNLILKLHIEINIFNTQ